MNSNYLAFSSCPGDYQTQQCRWSHNFYWDTIIQYSHDSCASANFYRTSGRWQMWSSCVNHPWRNSRWIVAWGKSWQIASPPKGKRISTTTKKITDWDIPATLNLTWAVKSYFRWLRVTQLSGQIIKSTLSLWHQEIMTLVTLLPVHLLAKQPCWYLLLYNF